MFKSGSPRKDQLRPALAFTLSVLSCNLFAQANLATVYTQDFGSTDIAAWTDNSTITGWYGAASGTFSFGHQDVTAAAPSNTGRMYSYECNGDNNQKLGSRSSGTTATLHYGVRLANTSGSAISFLLVEFDWYQFSLAENGSTANTITFSYQQAATVTSLTGGVWTSVAALDFTAPQSSAVAGSSQIQGYPCTETGFNSACITVNIPAGEEIMLRWTDINDANNDHHLGIDNLFVGIATDNSCSFILESGLLNLSAVSVGNDALITWSALTVQNGDSFLIDRSPDGVHFSSVDRKNEGGDPVPGDVYSFLDEFVPASKTTFYRLRHFDLQGNLRDVKLTAMEHSSSEMNYFDGMIQVWPRKPFENLFHAKIYDVSGRVIYSGEHSEAIPISWHRSGIFILEIEETEERFRFCAPER